MIEGDSNSLQPFTKKSNSNNKPIVRLKINYIKNTRVTSKEENDYVLARLVSLFAQVGIAEFKQSNNELKI